MMNSNNNHHSSLNHDETRNAFDVSMTSQPEQIPFAVRASLSRDYSQLADLLGQLDAKIEKFSASMQKNIVDTAPAIATLTKIWDEHTNIAEETKSPSSSSLRTQRSEYKVREQDDDQTEDLNDIDGIMIKDNDDILLI